MSANPDPRASAAALIDGIEEEKYALQERVSTLELDLEIIEGKLTACEDERNDAVKERDKLQQALDLMEGDRDSWQEEAERLLNLNSLYYIAEELNYRLITGERLMLVEGETMTQVYHFSANTDRLAAKVHDKHIGKGYYKPVNRTMYIQEVMLGETLDSIFLDIPAPEGGTP